MEDREDETEENSRQKTGGRRGKALAAAAGIFLGIAGALYLTGVWFFQAHFLPDTEIDGEDCGWQKVEQVQARVREQADRYVLTVYGRDGVVDTIAGNEIGLEPVFDGSLERIRDGQNVFAWPCSLWQPARYDLPRPVRYDAGRLEEKMNTLALFDRKNQKPPVDAYIGDYEETTHAYAVIPEIPGSTVIREAAQERMEEAILALESELDLQASDCFVLPKVTTETAWINRVVKTLNRYVGTRVQYDWNGAEEIVDGTQIHNWLYVKDKKVEIDEEKVYAYVSELAKKHDTFGKKREFVTTEGETITLAGGSYGWWSDRSGETQELIALIKKGETVQREPLYHGQGYVKGQDDIGTSYVEIDLGRQHLYLYLEGSLVLESDFVSGNVSKGRGTPAGVFGITYKQRNATLRGANYATPVKYWMPFNGNIGMHDAGWRGRFGGEVYRTNGSHGCINLPPAKAAEIYEKVEKGFPVICYN